MPSNEARTRLKIGRTFALAGATIYCLLRSGILITTPPEELSGAAQLITADGALAWLWAAAWAVAAVWCIVDMIRGQTRHGLAVAVALAFTWGSGHLLNWGLSGFTNTAWLSALGFYAPCLIIVGMLLKVRALYDLIEEVTAHLGEQNRE